jgi:hypothetical protein
MQRGHPWNARRASAQRTSASQIEVLNPDERNGDNWLRETPDEPTQPASRGTDVPNGGTSVLMGARLRMTPGD